MYAIICFLADNRRFSVREHFLLLFVTCFKFLRRWSGFSIVGKQNCSLRTITTFWGPLAQVAWKPFTKKVPCDLRWQAGIRTSNSSIRFYETTSEKFSRKNSVECFCFIMPSFILDHELWVSESAPKFAIRNILTIFFNLSAQNNLFRYSLIENHVFFNYRGRTIRNSFTMHRILEKKLFLFQFLHENFFSVFTSV